MLELMVDQCNGMDEEEERVKGLCDDARLRKKVGLGLDEKAMRYCVRREEFMDLPQRGRGSSRWYLDHK